MNTRLKLRAQRTWTQPVIDRSHPDVGDIPGGFETGSTVKVHLRGRDEYHMIVTTMETTRESESGLWSHLRMEHWMSPNGLEWKRQRVLYPPHHAPETGLWVQTASVVPFYDEERDRWAIHFNYVALNGVRNWGVPCLLRRVEAQTPGIEGIYGDFDFPGEVVAQSGVAYPTDAYAASLSAPFQTKAGRWMAFLGGGPKPLTPDSGRWWVSLVSASRACGPFKFENDLAPIPIVEPTGFAENCLLVRLCGAQTGREYWAITFNFLEPEISTGRNSTLGFCFSHNGRDWPSEHGQIVDPTDGLAEGERPWWSKIRTPHQLILEDDGTYTCFFTAYDAVGFEAVGRMQVEVLEEVIPL